MKYNRRAIIIIVIIVILLLLFKYTYVKEDFQSDLKVAVMAIFKNEAIGIREWVDHYIWQGVDKILLLDNNSTDNYKEKLIGLESTVKVLPAEKNHAQGEHYNTIGKNWLINNNIDVVIVVDLDEFLYVKNGKTLKEYLTDTFSVKDRPSQILVRWTMFGSSNLETQPESIRKSFTWKQKELDENTKGIIYMKNLNKFGIHSHDIYGETILDDDNLQINHYPIQSKEFF